MTRASDRDLIEQAVYCINRLLAYQFLDHGEAWVKAWYRHDLKWSKQPLEYVTIPEGKVGAFVALGRAEPEVFDLVCFVAGTRLHSGATLPPDLCKFAGEFFLGHLKRPKNMAGRSSNWGRNFIIIRTMKEINPGAFFDSEDARYHTVNLDQRGIRKRELAASEIVFEALQRTRIGHVDKKVINDIWSSRKWQAAHDEAYSFYLGDMLDDLDGVVRI